MALSPVQRKELLKIIGTAYPVEGPFNNVLLNGPGMALDDLAKPGIRLERYLAAIVALDARNLIVALFEAIYDDQPDNAPLKEDLADLFNAIWPEGEPDNPHLHLLPDNVAFVNRDSLRGLLSGVVTGGSPRVILLRGRGLAGASHCQYLIRHVALQNAGIQIVSVNLDRIFERTPSEIIKTLALRAGFGLPPPRNDLIGADGKPDAESAQLTSHLCNWFIGKARAWQQASDQALWLVIDNAHRDTVPAPAREMVAALVGLVDEGMVEGLHLFVLGAERTMPVVLPFTVEQVEIPPLGRPDIAAYLAAVQVRHGKLDAFPTPEAAAEAILGGVDLDLPEAGALHAMTSGLTALVRGLR